MVEMMVRGSASSRAARWLCGAVVLWLSITVWWAPFAAAQQVVIAPEAKESLYSSDPVELDRRESHLNVFDEVWQIVRDRYYDPSLHGTDWAALRETLRPLAAQAQSSDELYRVLRRMLRGLRDSHTRVYTPEEKFDWHQPRYLSTGLTIREVEGKLIVAAIEPQSFAEKEGVNVGDYVINVDGEAAPAVLQRLLNEQVSASRVATEKFQAVSMLLDGPRGQEVAVDLRDQSGRERRVRLNREERERTPSFRLRRAQNDIWIVDFNVFTPQIAVDFTRALRMELRKAHGLVIDLRQNGGGEAEAMVEIISTMLPPGTELGQFRDRNGHIFLSSRTRSALLFSADRMPHFKAPLVILTSEKTASAAEIFAYALQQQKRAIIYGMQTCGCVLGVSRARRLADGGTLAISEMDYRAADGTRLEGAGVTPDEQLALSVSDVVIHRDAVLSRALDTLRRR